MRSYLLPASHPPLLARVVVVAAVVASLIVGLSHSGIAGASQSSNTGVRLSENFNGYPDGPLPTGPDSPWSLQSEPVAGDAVVQAGALQLPEGGVDTVVATFAAANSVVNDLAPADGGNSFVVDPAPASGPTWVGFSLCLRTGTPAGGEFAQLLDGSGNRLAGLCLLPGADAGSWSVGVTTPAGTAVDAASIASGIAARVVVSHDPVAGTVGVAVEPASEADVSARVACVPGAPGAVAFGAAAGSGDVAVDNLLVSDAFLDVAVSQMTGNVAGATLTVTAVNPGNGGVVPGGQYIEIMGIDVACTGANATFVSVTVDASGTGDDKTMVAAVRFGRDANSNNQLDPGEQTDSTRIDPDNGTITLSSGGRAMTAGTTERWLIAYDFESNAAGSFQLTMTSITADGGTATAGLPVSSATLGSAGGGGGCGVLPTGREGALAPTLLLFALLAVVGIRRRCA